MKVIPTKTVVEYSGFTLQSIITTPQRFTQITPDLAIDLNTISAVKRVTRDNSSYMLEGYIISIDGNECFFDPQEAEIILGHLNIQP